MNFDYTPKVQELRSQGYDGAITLLAGEAHLPYDRPPLSKEFLAGKSTGVQARLSRHMAEAAEHQDYELAAVYRDRLRALTYIQGSQTVHAEGLGDADVFALACKAGTVSIRERGEQPSFNVLRVERPRIAVERFVWDPVGGRFLEITAGTYRHTDTGWIPEPAV